MKVKFVSVEEGVSALGFRRVAAVARRLLPSTEIYFVPIGGWYSIAKYIDPGSSSTISDDQIACIAEELADADLVAFSSMSASAPWVVEISRAIKQRNPSSFVLWGGPHCILCPEEAIPHVDAICTGEGEAAYEAFFPVFAEGRDCRATPGMWFRHGNAIFRNPTAPLLTDAELDLAPRPYAEFSCRVFDNGKNLFRPFTAQDHVRYNGLAYRTVWTLGCPYSCVYCSNEAFVAIDKHRREVRHPSVAHLIEELEAVTLSHPFVCTIVFYDDNFIAVPAKTLRLFCEEYRQRIGLPFVIFGMHPNLVTEEKLDLLGQAGMNRCRLGIQSGSERILDFYDRRTRLSRIADSARILARAAKKFKMIPPAFDVISDNPIATREDELATLQFFYELERPFTLTVFSLRAFPETRLWKLLQDNSVPALYESGSTYLETRASMVNMLLYMLGIGTPPRWLFSRLLRHVKGYAEEQKYYPLRTRILRFLLLAVRGLQHLRRLDFTTLTGTWVYYLWKLGIVRRRRMEKGLTNTIAVNPRAER